MFKGDCLAVDCIGAGSMVNGDSLVSSTFSNKDLTAPASLAEGALAYLRMLNSCDAIDGITRLCKRTTTVEAAWSEHNASSQTYAGPPPRSAWRVSTMVPQRSDYANPDESDKRRIITKRRRRSVKSNGAFQGSAFCTTDLISCRS